MAVPKGKVSKQRRNSRRAQTWTLGAPATAICAQCKSVKLAHRVCPTCGYYARKKIVEVAEA